MPATKLDNLLSHFKLPQPNECQTCCGEGFYLSYTNSLGVTDYFNGPFAVKCSDCENDW